MDSRCVELGLMLHACNSGTWEAEAGGSGIKASVGYTTSLRLAWTPRDLVSNIGTNHANNKTIKTMCWFFESQTLVQMLTLSLAFLCAYISGLVRKRWVIYTCHYHQCSLMGFRHWFEFSFQLLIFLSLLLWALVFPPLFLASWTFVNDNQMLINGECLLGARHCLTESSWQSWQQALMLIPFYTGKQILRLGEVQ